VFETLQVYLGSLYVNDFNRFGRTWQVKVQADAPDRKTVDDIFRVRVRTAQGDLIPLRTVADVELITAPASIIRYNNRRSVTINGGPAPGYSSGEAMAAMEAVAAANLPHGFSYEWTGTALQEKAAAGQTGPILGLAIVFAYLFLVGLYESWTIPVAALLSVVVGLFGAMAALKLFGLDNNIYAQIGIVVLIIVLANDGVATALLAALVVLLGLSGHYLRRWSLDRRGYLLAQVVVARNEIEVLGRLLDRRPGLRGRFLPPLAAAPELNEISLNVPSCLLIKTKLGQVSLATAMSVQPSLFRSASTTPMPLASGIPTPDFSLTSVNVPS